jgi:hypothetical protein
MKYEDQTYPKYDFKKNLDVHCFHLLKILNIFLENIFYFDVLDTRHSFKSLLILLSENSALIKE